MGSGSSPCQESLDQLWATLGVVGPCFTQAWLTSLFSRTDAQSFGLLDPKLCYLLDGILFIYGVIITALFLRVKVGTAMLGGPHSGMFRGAWVVGSLRHGWCLLLGVHGQSRAQPSVPAGWAGKVGG